MRSVALWAALVCGIAGSAAALVPAGAAAAPACAATLVPSDEAALTAMINLARTAQGVPRVTRDRALRAVGRRKSMAMANGAAFEHEGGALPWADGREAGQNIAMATSAGAAFQAMLDSPGHRRNLMGGAWRHAGVGAALSCDGMLFVTVNLMVPSGAG
jgi:uncharacterized protein YkwD